MDDYYIHPTSIVNKSASIGHETKIWHFSHVRENVKIGKNVTIGQNVYIDKDVVIGNNCKIQNNVSIYKGVRIDSNVFIGPSVTFTNDLYPNVEEWSEDKIILTHIKSGVSIGANSTILCGISLNENALIGAGSVVTKDIPKNVIAFGNPAIIKKIKDI
jgi:UDP-2-acetamido-3-amino-2,3-dideoxy-glucuronate N-acetyltransferase